MILGTNQPIGNSDLCKLNLRGEAFTDSSPSGKSVTNNGASLDTSIYKTNGSSYSFPGTVGNRITAGAAGDFEFGSKDLTIAMWFRFDAYPVTKPVLFILGDIGGSGSEKQIGFRYDSGSNEFDILYAFNSSTWNAYSVGQAINTSTWYHIALVRSGVNLLFFLDGILLDSTNIGSTALNNTSRAADIGACYNSSEPGYSWYYIDGNIDNLMVYNGLALYTHSFQPPNRSF